MPKFETRDVMAVLALSLFGGALWLDHLHPLADWAKTILDTGVGMVFGYYFTSSPQRAQGGAPSPSGQSAPPVTPKAPDPAPASPEGQ